MEFGSQPTIHQRQEEKIYHNMENDGSTWPTSESFWNPPMHQAQSYINCINLGHQQIFCEDISCSRLEKKKSSKKRTEALLNFRKTFPKSMQCLSLEMLTMFMDSEETEMFERACLEGDDLKKEETVQNPSNVWQSPLSCLTPIYEGLTVDRQERPCLEFHQTTKSYPV